MTLKTEFMVKYGAAIEKLAASWLSRLKFDVQSRECQFVFLDWTTRQRLCARISIFVDIEYLEIGSCLNYYNIHSDRVRCWNTAPSILRGRLEELKRRLELIDRKQLPDHIRY